MAALEVDDLRFAYPDGTPSLRGVSFRVAPGEKVALVGPNGAGKSTLLLNLNGILRAHGGTVRVFGEELSERSAPLIRARVGLLFSNPDDQLFSATVLEDVAYGPLHMGLPEDEVLARSREALRAVGMAGFEDRVPHRLSLGQKRRVAIATVLSMGTPILALDEPTASLDPRSRRELIELLDRLPLTILVATHDLGMVSDVLPRTILMDAGLAIADGQSRLILNDAVTLGAHGLEPLSAHGHPHA
ncbi:MAG: ABC transporter ATP-binding protein [Chloroflexi bacterium]|nr:ABC transporter ATP-binding protein [Chloroflexota bacterium]